MNDSARIHMMAVEDIPIEHGSQEMATSPDMQPYLAHIEAAITGNGSDAARKALSELPLEKRYLWRIVTGLKLAFCDFDKSSVRADLGTMCAEDFDEVMELILRRPVQFCMLLRTMLGAHEMEQVMQEAVSIAKRY